MDAPTPFSATPPATQGGIMIAAKPRKRTPKNERNDDLCHTLIRATNQKLERMNVQQLREVYTVALGILSRQNDPQKPKYRSKRF